MKNVPLVNMIKEGSENKPALLILLIFYKKKHKNLSFHWTKTIEIGGKTHYEINVFFSNTRWTQLLVPLESLMSKISLK